MKYFAGFIVVNILLIIFFVDHSRTLGGKIIKDEKGIHIRYTADASSLFKRKSYYKAVSTLAKLARQFTRKHPAKNTVMIKIQHLEPMRKVSSYPTTSAVPSRITFVQEFLFHIPQKKNISSYLTQLSNAILLEIEKKYGQHLY